MPCQRGYFLHCRVLPDNYLVQAVAMRTHQLVIGLREDKIADLAACVDGTYRLQGQGVPETDVLVGSATPGCQETSMQRTPVNCLHSGLVLRKLAQRLLVVTRYVPDHKLVVIAT